MREWHHVIYVKHGTFFVNRHVQKRMKFLSVCMKNILRYVRISQESHSEECGHHTLGVWLEFLKEYINERHSPLETSSWDFEEDCVGKRLVKKHVVVKSLQESRWLFVSKASSLWSEQPEKHGEAPSKLPPKLGRIATNYFMQNVVHSDDKKSHEPHRG